MDAHPARPLSLGQTLLRLGRVSNLPTVWTNCLAGAGLAAQAPTWPLVLSGAAAMSMIYTGGMFLNDAFDHRHDEVHAPERPIPSGRIGVGTVLGLGFLQLFVGVVAVAVASVRFGAGTDQATLASAVALALLVVLYDLWHKKNPWSPWLMAGCRGLVYVTVGLLAAGGHAAPQLWLGIVTITLYVASLTWLAKREARGLSLEAFGGFATFVAAISLVDAFVLACVGRFDWAGLAAVGFPSTLLLQRWVRGT